MNAAHFRRLVFVIVVASTFAVIAPLSAAAQVWEGEFDSPAQRSESSVAYRLVDAVFNDFDADVASVLIAEDATIHTPYGDFVGPSGLDTYVGIATRAYPDASFKVTNVSTSGNTMVIHWVMTATIFQLEPYDTQLNVNTELPGELTITLADARISDASIVTGDFVVTDLDDVVVTSSGSVADCLVPCVLR
jgi:hypothetical protein